jgi:HK97 gp10 family phage protein
MGSAFKVYANISDAVYKSLAQISRYDEATQQRLKDIVRDKTSQVYKLAVTGVRKRTGKLAASIKMEVNTTGTKAVGKVMAKSPHARMLEFGHRGAVVVPIRRKALAPGADGWFMAKAVLPYQAAHPFMKPAIDAVRPGLEAAVKEAVTHD